MFLCLSYFVLNVVLYLQCIIVESHINILMEDSLYWTEIVDFVNLNQVKISLIVTEINGLLNMFFLWVNLG